MNLATAFYCTSCFFFTDLYSAKNDAPLVSYSLLNPYKLKQSFNRLNKRIGKMLSVVLPTYNVQRYIDRCIKSLLKQTNRNFEIVFIDDGSTDKSAEIIKKYQNKNKNIKLIQLNKNIGTFHAREIGARKASGRYIIFLDPDDELKSEMVERFYQLISSKSPDMVFF